MVLDQVKSDRGLVVERVREEDGCDHVGGLQNVAERLLERDIVGRVARAGKRLDGLGCVVGSNLENRADKMDDALRKRWGIGVSLGVGYFVVERTGDLLWMIKQAVL